MEVEVELEVVYVPEEVDGGIDYDKNDVDGDKDPQEQTQTSHMVTERLTRPAADGDILILVGKGIFGGDSEQGFLPTAPLACK
eukprot:5034802-Pyramimonas_sp.AAC.1